MRQGTVIQARIVEGWRGLAPETRTWAAMAGVAISLLVLLGILLGPVGALESRLVTKLAAERQRTTNMRALEEDIARLGLAQDGTRAPRSLRPGDIENLARGVLPGREIKATLEGGQLRLTVGASPLASVINAIEAIRKVERLRLVRAQFRGADDGQCMAELTFAAAEE